MSFQHEIYCDEPRGVSSCKQTPVAASVVFVRRHGENASLLFVRGSVELTVYIRYCAVDVRVIH